MELHDAYLSVKEALIHAGIAHQVRVDIRWVHSERLEQEPVASLLEGVDGILVARRFGERGIEGKLEAARYARENKIPYLGVCLGMQIMVIEFARHILGLLRRELDRVQRAGAASGDQPAQRATGHRGQGRHDAPRRLPVHAGSRYEGARRRTASTSVIERHRHRYEFNNKYREQLAAAGLIASGTSPDGSLVEICGDRRPPVHARVAVPPRVPVAT